jgi:hypothetical protein
MARKKNELGDVTTDRIVALMRVGATAEVVYKTLRAEGVKKISLATIGRRMKELRPRAKKARAETLAKKAGAKAAPPASSAKARTIPRPMPTSPEEIPEDADVSDFDVWLTNAKSMADAAYAEGDLDGFGKMGRLTSMLLEAKRKATPPKPPDANERPDMIAARERARTAFHELIKRVLPTKDDA